MRYLPVFRRISLQCARRFLFSAGLLGGLMVNAVAGTALPSTFNFTATFVAPTCTMTTSGPVDFTPEGMGAGIPSSELTGDGKAYPGGLTLTFSDCDSGGMTRPPKIVVSGRTVSLGGSELYFADIPETVGTYTANRYGIKLSLSGQSNFEDSLNIATVPGISGGGVINTKTGSTLTSLNGNSLNLNVNLTCGSYSPCNQEPGYIGGAFKATVTFQMVYD